MNDNQTRDQAKAIREDIDKLPKPAPESPREARWRVERERAQAEAKAKPHRGY
ncbi:hypothetical protein [Paraburkholderia sediminicola]|uniref:hypothetical protein n=1 Tax=Paraburkholderia sediminicola TaxID=458836 RepID=UPI0038BC5F17